MITMTRRIGFSAALADWIPALSKAENEQVFGPTASPEPYGHNYLLAVTVDGEIDPRTGMVINIKILDKIVRDHVVELLDRKFLNHAVPDFCSRAVTLEVMTEYIAAQIAPHLPPQIVLRTVGLEETPESRAEWQAAPRREAKQMLVTRTYEFAASHRLNSPHLTAEENHELFGKCNNDNGHGHNYLLDVTISGPLDARSGRVLPPEVLDAIVEREIVDRYDHKHLNLDLPDFAGLIPSAEVITKVIWERLQNHIPPPARLERVLLHETARNLFEYRGEGDNNE